MRVLLDTHAFLWFVLDDPKLSLAAMALIADPANEVLLSPASYWEIAINVSIGKYQLPRPFRIAPPHHRQPAATAHRLANHRCRLDRHRHRLDHRRRPGRVGHVSGRYS